MEEKAKQVIQQYDKLKAIREPLDKIYADLFNVTYPLRGSGFLQDSEDGITNALAARDRQARLFDSTATDSVRLLASSVLSAITPPNLQWFNLGIIGKEEDELSIESREWMEDGAETIFTIIHSSSNYDAQSLEFFTDLMVGGMCGLYIEPRNGTFFFETWPLHSMYVQDSTGNGRVNTIYRKVNLTPSEAVEKFGIDSLPDKIRTEYETNPYCAKTFPFIHTIRPRPYGKSRKLKKQLPYESLYVCAQTQTVVKESGFNEMPVIIPRWMKIPDTDYAFGPVSDALPDIKTLNKIVEYLLTNADMAIAGTYVAKDDGIINPNAIKIGPRRIIMAADVDNIKPLVSGGDINFAVNEITRLQAQIRRTLLADQLGPTEKAIMTATEVQTRNNLIRQILGPIFSRMQAEYLQGLIERCFGIALREGWIGTPPEELRGQDVKIVYRSPLARSQKMQDLQAMDEFEARLVQTAQYRPEVLDMYDTDKALRKKADYLGIDVELLKDEATVRRERQAKQEAQQQQAMMQAIATQQSDPTAATQLPIA